LQESDAFLFNFRLNIDNLSVERIYETLLCYF